MDFADQSFLQKEELLSLLHHFLEPGTIEDVKPLGSGLINDTFQVVVDGQPSFVLQRINHHIFSDVKLLMENIQRVTAHLQRKMKVSPNDFPFQDVLSFIPTNSGEFFYKDDKGNYWRLAQFISKSVCIEQMQTQVQAQSAGWAFGQFHTLLRDLSPKEIGETIPRFHHIGWRLEQLEEAVEQDLVGRGKNLKAEIAWVRDRKDTMMTLIHWGEAGWLPSRILHYDTKINNVLFDAEGKVRSVIDLDTVMPGFVAYDVGDAIRSIINTRPEDEPDVEKIALNLSFFEAFIHGYLTATTGWLTEKELESLLYGVLLLPYMQSVRFLTDYLNGDNYYKIAHADHNLQRAKAQMQLVELLERNREILEQIIVEKSRVKN